MVIVVVVVVVEVLLLLLVTAVTAEALGREPAAEAADSAPTASEHLVYSLLLLIIISIREPILSNRAIDATCLSCHS